MGLFKRKTDEPDSPTCPACGERIPPGATSCAMCGRDLADVQAPAHQPGGSLAGNELSPQASTSSRGGGSAGTG